VPVEALRAELERVVQGSSLWDKRVVGLQVTNLSEKTMELRCLMSSADSSKSFDLRCLVREKMIEFVKANYPQALPTLRMEMRDVTPKLGPQQMLSTAESGVPSDGMQASVAHSSSSRPAA
jgi:hypothetical protein